MDYSVVFLLLLFFVVVVINVIVVVDPRNPALKFGQNWVCNS